MNRVQIPSLLLLDRCARPTLMKSVSSYHGESPSGMALGLGLRFRVFDSLFSDVSEFSGLRAGSIPVGLWETSHP